RPRLQQPGYRRQAAVRSHGSGAAHAFTIADSVTEPAASPRRLVAVPAVHGEGRQGSASAWGEDVELVTLRVGQARPRHVALADVDAGGAESLQPGHLRRVIVTGVRPQVEMHADLGLVEGEVVLAELEALLNRPPLMPLKRNPSLAGCPVLGR